MIVYITIAGLVSLIFGILFLLAPVSFWSRMSNFMNRPVVDIEDRLRHVKSPLMGIIFLMVGVWVIYTALKFVDLWFFHILGSLIVIIGLIYIFIPSWILRISQASGQQILTMDKVAITSRMSFGIMLILASIYIFLKLLMILRIF
jgi:hypothetical protein